MEKVTCREIQTQACFPVRVQFFIQFTLPKDMEICYWNDIEVSLWIMKLQEFRNFVRL